MQPTADPVETAVIFQTLVRARANPTVEAVANLAKLIYPGDRYTGCTPQQFWALFDRIRVLRADLHSYESMADWC